MAITETDLLPTDLLEGVGCVDVGSVQPTTEVVFDELDYSHRGVRMLLVGPGDYRVPAAQEMEIATMAGFGDPPEQVREEFKPYHDASVFILAFDGEAEPTPSSLKGMVRLIPHHDDLGLKTLNDLARIEDAPVQEIETRFMDEAGCTDLSKVWDMATLGVDQASSSFDRMRLTDTMIYGLAQYISCAYSHGQLTHVVSFNEAEHAHPYFLRKGYPFKDMLGRGPMVYDTYKDGKGMIAQPAWCSAEEVVNALKSQATRHLAEFVLLPCKQFDLASLR